MKFAETLDWENHGMGENSRKPWTERNQGISAINQMVCCFIFVYLVRQANHEQVNLKIERA